MKTIFLGLNLFVFLLASYSMTAQHQRTIRDVVLLNVEPFEVLMTENGEIITKIRHIPNYLNLEKKIQALSIKSEIALNPKVESQKEVIAADIVSPFKKIEKRVVSQTVPNGNFKEYYEIEFTPGTATLSSRAIASLNELATVLQSNPDRKVQIFGFQNEAPLLASLLSKRRRDGCVAYLKIKGVNTREQLRLGSITKGANNKIVFGFE